MRLLSVLAILHSVNGNCDESFHKASLCVAQTYDVNSDCTISKHEFCLFKSSLATMFRTLFNSKYSGTPKCNGHHLNHRDENTNLFSVFNSDGSNETISVKMLLGEARAKSAISTSGWCKLVANRIMHDANIIAPSSQCTTGSLAPSICDFAF
jgi:hypothetical protein